MKQIISSHLCLAASNFNIWHPAWQFFTQSFPRTEPFLLWTEFQELILILLSDLPPQGSNIINLVWAKNILLNLGIFSEVVTDLSSLTDHKLILTIIEWGLSNLPWDLSSLQWFILDERLFRTTLQEEECHVAENQLTFLLSTGQTLQSASLRQSSLLWRLPLNKHPSVQMSIDDGIRIVPTQSRYSTESHEISASVLKTYKKPNKSSSILLQHSKCNF